MFRQIRLRLVLWNSTVVFVILAIFGGVFFLDLRHRLYFALDQEIRTQAQSAVSIIERGHVPPPLIDGRTGASQNHGPFQGMPMNLILWNNAGEVVSPLPEFVDGGMEAQLRTLAIKHADGLINTSDYHFRVVTTVINPATGTTAAPVILEVLRNTDDLTETLRQTARVVVAGIFLGAIFAIIAGLLLAHRALVPIRQAWDKQVQFVADASHELRTPLTAIAAHTELLLREPTKTISDKAETVSGILSETRRMNRLVRYLLTLARSDADIQQLERVPLRVDALITDVVEQFRPLAEGKSIQLEFTGYQDGATAPQNQEITATLDGERIRQLLLILLDNALKFTNPGGQITVSLKQLGRKLEISVSDTGCGISQADLPKIFHRFYRGDKSRSGTTHSAGLGLAIAKWIVDAHHGTITVRSQEGIGSTFTVVLPMK